jgi:hypothetical protein
LISVQKSINLPASQQSTHRKQLHDCRWLSDHFLISKLPVKLLLPKLLGSTWVCLCTTRYKEEKTTTCRGKIYSKTKKGNFFSSLT